jgi:putative DNA primase/helicase
MIQQSKDSSDTEAVLWLCEGESDTICALSHGLEAITATGGAGSWAEDGSEIFRGRDLVIAYDADLAGYNGAHKVAAKLKGLAARVRILLWPNEMLADKAPLDESHGQAQRRAQAAASASRDDIASGYVTRLPVKQGKDLTDFLVKFGSSVQDLETLLANAELIEVPESKPRDGDFGLILPSRFFIYSKSGRASFKPALLAHEIRTENDLITEPETGVTYRWNGEYWQTFGLPEIRKIALEKLGVEASQARASDAAAQVADLSVLPSGECLNPNPDILCLKNGNFNLRNGEIRPFKREHFCTYQLGVSFDPDRPAKCERWQQHLIDTVQIPEVIAEFQEFYGYCLTRETRFEKALLLVGPGADGKSTSLHVLQALVGEKNCANVQLGDLEDQFHRVSLHNRILNVFTELSSGALESGNFKAVVSGDRINAAYKHRDVFEFRPFCKIAGACNELPKVLDNSDGFFRKVLLIKHRKQFFGAERDPYLLDKLLEELPGIFSWAWVGLDRLRVRGEFRASQASQKAIDEYRQENNPVLAFIKECCITEPGAEGLREIPKQELFDAYSKYCKSRNFYPLNAVHFARQVSKALPQANKGKRTDYTASGNKVRVPIWRGVDLVE